ncbi:MAG: hypothetical protein HOO95_05745 [Gallionella sp.]|nr:hypothetical protein [Gallionella sp.]
MDVNPSETEITKLFSNLDPIEVWQNAFDILHRINPHYDSHIAKNAFDDVVRLFRGDYLGFQEVKTLYHDLHHTLDVFICVVRLMQGAHLSGTRLSDDDITLVIMAALMHDIGYAQLLDDETGTGAQYTSNHVDRSIEFMHEYIADQHLPTAYISPLKCMMQCTNPILNIADIDFPDEHTRMLGQLVCTADLTGQMAARTYLEKLLFLYLEFKEGNFGDYSSVHDLLIKTKQLYTAVQHKMDIELDGLYAKLTYYFKDKFAVERNFYLESIEKNIAYLTKITLLADHEHFAMLKRGGIVQKSSAQRFNFVS